MYFEYKTLFGRIKKVYFIKMYLKCFMKVFSIDKYFLKVCCQTLKVIYDAG